MAKRKFLREDYMRFSRLGKNRKKLQKWRAPTGTHSKMRRKRKGYPSFPTVGHRTPNKSSGLIQGLAPVLVHNLAEIKKVQKNQIVILAKIGAKKKLDLIKFAEEKGIKIANIGGKK